MEIYNERIRDYRMHLHLSREEFAGKADIPLEVLVGIEEGKQKATLDEVYAIVTTFGVSADYLCGFEDEPIPFKNPFRPEGGYLQ